MYKLHSCEYSLHNHQKQSEVHCHPGGLHVKLVQLLRYKKLGPHGSALSVTNYREGYSDMYFSLHPIK
jgi:hypothetical protein